MATEPIADPSAPEESEEVLPEPVQEETPLDVLWTCDECGTQYRITADIVRDTALYHYRGTHPGIEPPHDGRE